MDDAIWYYLESETPTGPFTWRRLVDLSKVGIIAPNTYVRSNESDDWICFVDAIDAMRAKQSIPSPLSPRPAVNKVSLSEPIIDGSASDEPHDVDAYQPLPVPPSSQTAILDARGWSTSPVAPWRRFGARMLDTTIHGVLGVLVFAYAWYSFAPISADEFFTFIATPSGTIVDFVLTSLAAALVGGFIVGATGTSIGKAIFGVKIVNASFEAIGISNGLKREFQVWFAGMALGIPIIALFTMIAAYRKLISHGTTTWDAGHNIVLYRPNGPFQRAMDALGIVLIFIVLGSVKILNDM